MEKAQKKNKKGKTNGLRNDAGGCRSSLSEGRALSGEWGITGSKYLQPGTLVNRKRLPDWLGVNHLRGLLHLGWIAEYAEVILILLLTCAASANAQVPAVKDEIACYNVITGRVFSAVECGLLFCRGTDGSGNQYSGTQVQYESGLGPCIPPRVEGEKNNEILCSFGPGFLESRGKPVQAFSSPNCADAKVEFRQCLNGTMLGSYRYPDCQ
jgi:hypothetical protein